MEGLMGRYLDRAPLPVYPTPMVDFNQDCKRVKAG
jgi:hypothetical protein